MSIDLDNRIEALAVADTLADGTPCRSIGVEAVINLSVEIGVTGRAIEIAALQQEILPVRYLRNRQTLSLKDQITLLNASVGIVGLGGLGGLVTDCLARLGIGRLHLVDGDVFAGHNLNRQLLSSTATIGKSKADAAAARVASINPSIEIFSDNAFLSPQNADTLLGTCDLVVDCLDNIPSRFTLESVAKQSGIPMVSAAIAGITGHVTTIYPGDKGLESIYGPPDQVKAPKGDELRLGCLAPGVNLIAALECTEVMKVLLQHPGCLRNQLLVVDLVDYVFETLQLS